MVVEVSPWTLATTRGPCRSIAAAIASSGTTSPQGASTDTIVVPIRCNISLNSSPNRPKSTTSTVSPGSTSDTSAASIAARAVPSIRKVQRLSVPNTGRYSAITCSI